MFMGQDGFIWWVGVVEDNNDPMLIGRARVRIFGYHPKANTNETYTNDGNNIVATQFLPWAIPILPLNLPNAYGKISVGEWVFGFFLDGESAQEPAILGYIPSAYRQEAYSFGKQATLRNFYDLGGATPDGEFTGSATDFATKSNRFEWHSPTNNHLRMMDAYDASGQKDVVLAHSIGNMYLQFLNRTNGTNAVTMHHPKGNYLQMNDDNVLLVLNGNYYVSLNKNNVTLSFGNDTTYIQLNNNDIIVKSPKGSYNLIDQLDWLEKGASGFPLGRRPPPPPPPPPRRRRGGGCFTQSTVVTMSDGSHKNICDVKVGEFVMNRDKTRINRVKFIEIVDGCRHKHLYSLKPTEVPFATLDHPLYLYDRLSAVDPKMVYDLYPWLGELDRISLPNIEENTEKYVYNLWVDGDNTYIVNGYGTTSIIADGGSLSRFLELGYYSEEEIREFYKEYTTRGPFLLQGAYAYNYILGKLDLKPLYDLGAYALTGKYSSLKRRLIVNIPMRILALTMKAFSKFNLWRFFK